MIIFLLPIQTPFTWHTNILKMVLSLMRNGYKYNYYPQGYYVFYHRTLSQSSKCIFDWSIPNFMSCLWKEHDISIGKLLKRLNHFCMKKFQRNKKWGVLLLNCHNYRLWAVRAIFWLTPNIQKRFCFLIDTLLKFWNRNLILTEALAGWSTHSHRMSFSI